MPGDIVLIEAGEVVPADIRLINVIGLEIDESALTGESLSVTKQTDAMQSGDDMIGDYLNMAFKGTQITRGHGKVSLWRRGVRRK